MFMGGGTFHVHGWGFMGTFTWDKSTSHTWGCLPYAIVCREYLSGQIEKKTEFFFHNQKVKMIRNSSTII